MQRFEEILGNHEARPFVNAVILAVANNPKLLDCTQASIITAAIRAAMLRLSVNDPTGQAWIVPYGNLAQFQVGYKGLRDMATEGGKVRYLNVAEIYEGEYLVEDRFTGLYEIKGEKKSEKVHTLLCYYKDIYGFEKMIARTIEEIHKHAKTYNPGGYNAKGSPWQSDKPRTVRAMERKTILREMINAWVPLDPYKKKLINNFDETAHEDVGVLEARFQPDPIPEGNENDLLAELGYDPEPAPVSSPAPVVTETYPLPLDMALTAVDSKGVLYKSMTNEVLAKKSEGYAKALQKEKNSEEIQKLQFKLAAIGTLLQYRANHPEA